MSKKEPTTYHTEPVKPTNPPAPAPKSDQNRRHGEDSRTRTADSLPNKRDSTPDHRKDRK